MKILAIGDFHGKFPQKLARFIRREKPDLILSNGDYTGIDEFRPALKKMFKMSERGEDFSFEDYFGKDRYKRLLKKDYAAGKIPLRELNKIGIRVLSVFGNGDWYKSFFNNTGMEYDKFVKRLKNFKNVNRGRAGFRELKIVGFGGYLDPDVYFTRKGMKAINVTFKKNKKRSKRYRDWERELMRLMKNKPDILLAHYTPYNCLDKMKEKGFMLTGSHMGVSSYNRAIKKYSPALVVCGHMHENQGSCKIGPSVVVNPGAAFEGKCALIEFDEKRKKVLNVKLFKNLS